MAQRSCGRALRTVISVVRPLLKLLTRHDWQGGDSFPDGGFVIVANHISHVDPLTLGHFLVESGTPPRFLAKASVLDVPLVGRILAASGQIPVYRGTATASHAFDAAVEAVEAGKAVIIYPEGTITREPRQWPMVGKTGAARVALATSCPVIPVAQWGPERILPPYSKRLRLWPPTTVTVRVGSCVPLDDLRGAELTTEILREATDRIMTAITALLEEIRGERAPAVRYDPQLHALPCIGNPHRPEGPDEARGA
ncbi:MAG: lysophospholipid acyltransferase family protein [Nocardioidaceae bacterium]